MTNAEKYIGDEDTINEFIDEIADYIIDNISDEFFKEDKEYIKQKLTKFFQKDLKPILTEDERVILKNIKSIHNVIGRNRDGNIRLMCKEPKIKDCIWNINFSCYNNLFQFIKERRRILY